MTSTAAIRSACTAFALVLVASPPSIAQDTQELPFLDISIQDAATRAEREGLLVMVYCHKDVEPACKQMLANTWTDASVRDWISKQAIAVRMGDDDLKSITRYGVGSWPTTIFMDPELKVLHRIIGMRRSAEFLIEANTVLLGVGEAKKPEGEAAENPMAWLAWGNWVFTNDTESAGEAVEAYLWCLDHGEDQQPGFRASYFNFLCERLAHLRKYDPAAPRGMVSRRDDLRGKIAAGIADERGVWEFVKFNFWLRTEPVNLELFDELAGRGERQDELRKELMHHVLDTLVANKRYDDIVAIVPDPQSEIAARLEALEKLEGKATIAERSEIVSDAVYYYEMLLAKGRGGDATVLLDHVTEKVPTGRAFCSFMERSNRLEYYTLTMATAEKGLAVVQGKGRRLIESQLKRLPKEKRAEWDARSGDEGDGGGGH